MENNPKKEYITKNLRLSKGVVDKVLEIAERENRTFNNMVEVILKRYNGNA